MNQDKHVVKYLKDYKKPDFSITTTELDFTILSDKITVKSNLLIKKVSSQKTLSLNGSDLITKSVFLDNKPLVENIDYTIKDDCLEVFNVPNSFSIQTEVEINPYTNTKLMGIYKSNSNIVSQCEPEGFRRITWFLDRPDIMSVWNVKISAQKDMFETLISNGNLISDTIDNDIRTCSFQDPFPKPSYLFAFVAGDFDVCSRVYTTKSGRDVDLNVYVEKGKREQAIIALDSLALSMKWDEETYNLEYELNVFSIVAVSDFNFGAMENTSLNIFNDAYVLADSYIATDDDFFNIQSIVAHEYFHNFTGNRITCRDWFQLTLKEGLTVFRDHKFSEDVYHRDIVRIKDVEVLERIQFQEDKGPLSHPIRPQSYIEINNFYTATVYEKGSEIIRMIETILGEEGFKKGIDKYFELFDSQAVTCDDFIYAMEQANNTSLSDFKRWYDQSGTPLVKVDTDYDSQKEEFTIKVTQTNVATADQKEKTNLVIPLKFALFDNSGKQMNLHVEDIDKGLEDILTLNNKTQEVIISNVKEKPILSINRFFSAPVVLDINQSDEDLSVLMNYDSDGFNKFQSSQKYLQKHMLNMIGMVENKSEIEDSYVDSVVKPYKTIIDNYEKDMYLTAKILNIPTFSMIESQFDKNLPIESIMHVIRVLEKSMALQYENEFLHIFNTIHDNEEDFTIEMISKRSIKNKSLSYLLKTQKEKYLQIALDYFNNTKSMTKKIAVLSSIKNLYNTKEHKDVFNSFYEEFHSYSTVVNKWFYVTSSIEQDHAIEKVKKLTQLNTFSYTNPNNVRHLFGGFINNHNAFHNVNGDGYSFLAENIIKIDSLNPSLSSSLAKVFAKVNLHTQERQKIIYETINNNILSHSEISKGLYEILYKISNQK